MFGNFNALKDIKTLKNKRPKIVWMRFSFGFVYTITHNYGKINRILKKSFFFSSHLLITSNSNKNFTIFWAQQTIFPPKWKKKTNVNRFLGFFKASIFDFYNHFFLKIYFFLSFFKKNFFKFKRAVFYFLETGFQFFQNANGFQAFYILHAAFKINGGANVTSIAFYFNFLIHMFS